MSDDPAPNLEADAKMTFNVFGVKFSPGGCTIISLVRDVCYAHACTIILKRCREFDSFDVICVRGGAEASQ